MPNIRRRLFRRILIWQPATGNILDLTGRHVLSNSGPEKTEEYARLASGDQTPTRRSFTVEIPIAQREISEYCSVFQRSGCKVKAAFIGREPSDHWMWLEPTTLNITDPQVSPGQLSRKVIRLDSSIFYPAIWEGEDLVEGVPWHSTTQQTRNSNKVLRPAGNSRPGYEGPLWACGTDHKVLADGTFDPAQDQANPTLEFQFPLWGSTIEVIGLDKDTISGGGGGTDVAAFVNTFDYDGNSLNSTTTQQTLPDKTWLVQIELDLPTQIPQSKPIVKMEYLDAPNGIIYGKTSSDCTKVSSPH